jgi:hypothetical protein
MGSVLYLRINNEGNRSAGIEGLLTDFISEIHWIDPWNLKGDIDDFGRVQLKIMFPSLQHDLGIRLSGVIGFDKDEIMIGFLDFVSENRPGKLIGASEALFLERLIGKQKLMEAMDRLLHTLDRDEMDTARMYLETGRNVNASARHLYLHRNTFRYRLNKFITQTRLDIRENEQGRLLEIWFLLKELE